MSAVYALCEMCQMVVFFFSFFFLFFLGWGGGVRRCTDVPLEGSVRWICHLWKCQMSVDVCHCSCQVYHLHVTPVGWVYLLRKVSNGYNLPEKSNVVLFAGGVG